MAKHDDVTLHKMDARDAGRAELRRAQRRVLSEYDDAVEGEINRASNANEALPEIDSTFVRRHLAASSKIALAPARKKKELRSAVRP